MTRPIAANAEPLVIRYSLRQLLGGLLLCVLMFVTGWLGVFGLLKSPRFHGSFDRFLSALTLPISTTGIVLFAIPLLRNRTAIQTDHLGATFHLWKVHPLHIPWAEVKGCKMEETPQGQILVVDIDRPEQQLLALPLPDRWLVQGNIKRYGTPFAIPVRWLDIDENGVQDLLARLG